MKNREKGTLSGKGDVTLFPTSPCLAGAAEKKGNVPFSRSSLFNFIAEELGQFGVRLLTAVAGYDLLLSAVDVPLEIH